MADRIVIAYRLPIQPPEAAVGRAHLERMRALMLRVDARSGTLVAWSATHAVFAFPPEAVEDVVGLARTRGEESMGDEAPFAIGVSQGEITSLAPEGGQGDLAWGMPIVAAVSLAQVARPGEVVVGETVKALRTGKLLTTSARRTREAGVRVRGAVLDTAQPWRRDAEGRVGRLKVPELVAVEEPSSLVWMPGTLSVLRADPGLGGTRMLREVATHVGPAPTLSLAPSGSGLEPLGALRRAIGRALAGDVSPFLMELLPQVEMLSSGDGITLESAAKIINAFLWPKSASTSGALLVDDAQDVDSTSLAACAQAIKTAERGFTFVVRLDATCPPPPEVAELERGPEIELKPMSEEQGGALAAGAFGGQLDPLARKRWARLGGQSPLAIVESITLGVASGEIVWTEEIAKPRRRSAGRGRPRPARQWITLRAGDLPEAQKVLLCTVALLGGEVGAERLQRIMRRVDPSLSAIEGHVSELFRGRWMSSPQADWVALPSRSHKDALWDIVDGPRRALLHKAIADVIVDEEGRLGRAEAAFHAARAGEGPRAAALALAVATAASELGFEQTSTRLVAFAKEQDPTCEARAQAHLRSSIPAAREGNLPRVEIPIEGAALSKDIVELPTHEPPVEPAAESVAPATEISVPPPAVEAPIRAAKPDDDGISVVVTAPIQEKGTPVEGESEADRDSEPPTLAKLDGSPLSEPGALPKLEPAPSPPVPLVREKPKAAPQAPPAAEASASVGELPLPQQLTELAKHAVLSADTSALEKWIDGLAAVGEKVAFTDRMRAIARMSRGDIGDALRVLRRARVSLDPQAKALRCQTSLALGLALASAGRVDDALLEGLDALARARETSDDRGARACLSFLARLYAAVGRPEDADRLRPPAIVAGA
ncbi:MAG: hypothetical protein JNL38_17115 [Myxococcales bacterium]|nr:hypothetical protein [Myxococcales bacterium]